MFSTCPLIRPSVTTRYFENDFDAIWHKSLVGQGHETTVNSGVRRSKVKVTGGRS